MAFVLDASTALSWHFDDENTDLTVANRAFLEGVAVPRHWLLEVASGVLRGERRHRTHAAATEEFLEGLGDLYIEVDDTERDRVAAVLLPLARRYRLSVYDAAYLELAGRLGLELATYDDAMAAAAREIGIDVLGRNGT